MTEVNPAAALPVGNEIEPDELDTSDSDSAHGSDIESYTTSLKSEITNYRFENGRRYHAYKDGAYFLPNDEGESDRLDLFHHLLTLALGGALHLAPISKTPQRILDLGTGTGIWAIEMGDEYPSADCLGVDLSPIQPTLVPPNVRFEVDDIENEWVYGSKFDFIHARYLAGSLKNWPYLVEQAWRALKPGGWLELKDFDMQFYTISGTFKRGCAASVWTDEIIDGIKQIGREPEPGPKLEGWIKDAGFVNVEHRVFPIPVHIWPKDVGLKRCGAFNLAQFRDGLEPISLRIFTGVKGWSYEEVQVLLSSVREDLKNPRMQMQHNFHVAWGQKPLDAVDE